MLKYILFALLFAIMIINFAISKIWKLIFKKEINTKEEATIRLSSFGVALLLAVIIIFAA